MVLKRSKRCYSFENLARKSKETNCAFERERLVNYNRRQKFVMAQRRASIDLTVTQKPRQVFIKCLISRFKTTAKLRLLSNYNLTYKKQYGIHDPKVA